MKRLYLDTSLLVAALVHESGTAAAHHCLLSAAEQPWLISVWVTSELASALAIKRRQGVITPEETLQAWARFQTLQQQRLQTLSLVAEDFHTAAQLCLDAAAPALRAGDALHLALCRRQRSCLASFDRGLCAAAIHHGVAVELLRIPT